MQTILVVDDDPMIGTLFTTFLTRRGYETVSVESGLDALGFLQNSDVDLAIIDYMMADMNGVDLVIHLRTRPCCSMLPIIMLSARVDEESKAHGMAAGVNVYLSKPITPDELLTQIRALLPSS
jgi:DNA-binding response OmpR family regulator